MIIFVKNSPITRNNSKMAQMPNKKWLDSEDFKEIC
jgi:hypothetical protein